MSVVQLDQASINSILYSHNAMRAKYGAAPLKWDSSIANQAASWASHSKSYPNFMAQPNPHGQTQNVVSQLPYSSLIGNWNSEPIPQKPGTYNHVSQVLWKSTTHVGCGVAVGRDPKKNGQNDIILVCDYYPPGNFQGKQWNTVSTGRP
ncbi:hypothetical protein HDU79_002292 [Rhizoclosmatium sp. JEL0117]|nr:hypothetical protein HDU79_002292 [Rhizoclosmatium sp. JEL0117]